MAEAIKDVEITTTIAPGDTAEMGKKLEEAVKKGDSITARAMQNMLLRSGSSGTKQYRESMNSAGVKAAIAAPGTSTQGAAVTDLKRNLLQNHAGVKESAADLVKHAASKEGTTMEAVSNDAITWKMSSDDLVKQKSHSIEAADKAGGISQAQAREIRDDKRLYSRLDKDGRTTIDARAL